MILDYLTSNGLNKYPFRDDCSMVDDSKVFTFANDYILDLLITLKDASASKVKLTSFVNDTVTTTLTFGFNISTASDSSITDISLVVNYVDVVVNSFISYSDYICTLKVVVGPGLVREVSSTSHSYTFTNMYLEESAMLLCGPRVTSISFYNADNSLIKTITGNETGDISAYLQAGANTVFNFITNQLVVDIIPGAGTGLYDNCTNDRFLKKINNIGPDLLGNFLLLTDDCYTTTPISNGLSFDNICTPKCTSTQLADFAHYLNRVKDGMGTVANLAILVKSQINDQITAWETDILPNKNAPYFKTAVSKFKLYGSSIDFYYSIVVGLFNPKTYPIGVSISASSSSVTFRPDAIRFKTSTNVVLLSSPKVNSLVPCQSVARFEFVVKGQPTNTVDISGTLDTTSLVDIITLT